MPVPDSATVCGLPAAFDTNCNDADFNPVLLGENRTFTVHVPAGATLVDVQVSSPKPNCPEPAPVNDTAPAENVNAADPVLVTVTVAYDEFVPTTCSPNPTGSGDTENPGVAGPPSEMTQPCWLIS